jgi:hypothetical protein
MNSNTLNDYRYMKTTFLSASLALSFPFMTQAYAAPPVRSAADVCPKNDMVLTCTSQKEIIWNPKLNLYDKEKSPGRDETYILVIINEIIPSPEVTSLIFDYDADLTQRFSFIDHPKSYSIQAVFADVLPDGRCIYRYYDDTTSIALSQNPSAQTAIYDMLEEARHLTLTPDYVYKAPLFDDHPKCPLFVSYALPSYKRASPG